MVEALDYGVIAEAARRPHIDEQRFRRASEGGNHGPRLEWLWIDRRRRRQAAERHADADGLARSRGRADAGEVEANIVLAQRLPPDLKREARIRIGLPARASAQTSASAGSTRIDVARIDIARIDVGSVRGRRGEGGHCAGLARRRCADG